MKRPALVLSALPRETRDTLFLLLVIGWLIAPHAHNVPLWCSALALTVLLWRGWIAVRLLPLPRRPLVIGLLALATLATLWSHQRFLGRDPGVTMVVLLLVFKTLEMRGHRDIFVVFFLGFFVLLAHFFYSQSLPLAASMLVGLLGLLTALINSHRPVGRPSLWSSAKAALRLTALGAPIMLVLFVLFPRLAPLWGLPSDAVGGRSGLSATMEVGTLASLALDSSVAMRVQFEEPMPAQSALYFRGPVLSRFDGRQWFAAASPSGNQRSVEQVRQAAQLRTFGAPYRYQVTLEANHQPWLLVLDATPQAPTLEGYRATLSADLQWTVDHPIESLLRYQAVSYPQFRHGPERPEPGLDVFRSLPAGFNPRTVQWAQEWLQDPQWARAPTQTLVDEALRQLRTGGFRYTLDPGVFGKHTADEFWFDKRAGFCEHIASSFVILLRALHIPARVVTGYQGGERNALDGYWTVRQSDAHAWTEVWMDDKGWVRVDPTAAVAPARTGSLQRLLPTPNPLAQAFGTVFPPLFTLNLRAVWEAMNNRWNQWVLNYSNAQQMTLLRNLGFESPSWEDLSVLIVALLIIATVVSGLWTTLERNRLDPWLQLLHRAHERLQAAGYQINPSSPPRALCAQLDTLQPPLPPSDRQRLQDWLLQLEQWRYAAPNYPTQSPLQDRQRSRELTQLRKACDTLPWPAARPVGAAPL